MFRWGLPGAYLWFEGRDDTAFITFGRRKNPAPLLMCYLGSCLVLSAMWIGLRSICYRAAATLSRGGTRCLVVRISGQGVVLFAVLALTEVRTGFDPAGPGHERHVCGSAGLGRKAEGYGRRSLPLADRYGATFPSGWRRHHPPRIGLFGANPDEGGRVSCGSGGQGGVGRSRRYFKTVIRAVAGPVLVPRD